MTKAAESKEVAKTQGTSVLTKDRGDSLKQGYDPKDIIWPRALLLQYTPPKSVEVPDDVFKPGKVLNSLTLEELPKKFVPIAVRTKWIRFNAQETSKPGYDSTFEPGAKMWESEDPTDQRVIEQGAWGPNNEMPLATKFLEFFCLFEGLDMPVLLSFSKTSFPSGQRLLSLCQIGKEMYSFQYELGTKQDVNKQQQKYYTLTVRQAGKNTDEKFETCKAIFDFYARRGADIKVHGDAEDASPAHEEKRPF